MLLGKGLLTPAQEAFLRLFAQLPDQEQFYLTGGTALAELYLGHRLSFDLDLFTPQEDLILPFSYGVERACQAAGLAGSVTRRSIPCSYWLPKRTPDSTCTGSPSR
jgi:hypothetical protein